MRDEDQAFAKIVAEEFHEQWKPPVDPPAPAPAPTPDPGPAPDFHLDLFDDDESYRQVAHGSWRMSPSMWWGLGLIALGLVITIAKILPWRLPTWVGWIAIASFVAGVSLSLWHLTRHPHPPDEDGEV
ncbi:MAG: hypothetical protein FWD75_06140 [Propionibacteriaceae bacterium]|nr:hypothetical protein [Propionibacteriaceae bacterium]